MEINRQYIGARYVPKFADPIEWDNLRSYEGMTIVTYLGTSYTSKKPVPVGVELSDTEYWVVTGNYNEQVERYRQETESLRSDVAGYVEDVDDLSGLVNNINQLNGRSILIIGDSISDEQLYPNCWVKNFREKCEALNATVVNHSRQGRTIGVYTGATNTLVNSLASVPSGNYTDIIVFLGTNDWINQTPLGRLNVDNNNSVITNIKLFDAWRSVNYPNAKVTFITPLKARVADDIRHKLLQFYNKAIISACMFYSYKIIDAHSFAPMIQTEHISDWTIDGIHPKTDYSPYFADYILDSLCSETSCGCDLIHTTLAIGDVGGSATHVFAEYDNNSVCYRVTNFEASSVGLVKLADLPEECKTVAPIYGVGTYTLAGTSHTCLLLSTGSALYAQIDQSLSTGGVVAGSTVSGTILFGVNINNGSF